MIVDCTSLVATPKLVINYNFSNAIKVVNETRDRVEQSLVIYYIIVAFYYLNTGESLFNNIIWATKRSVQSGMGWLSAKGF